MSIGRSHAVTLSGLAGAMIGVEAHTANGLPAFKLVGLPDASLNEARDRVRAAVESSAITFPRRRVTVGLNPAALPKAGSLFDVAIAIAVLRAERLIRPDDGEVIIGELGLDGRIHPVRGVLPIVAAAVDAGFHRIFVPQGNAAEAALVATAEVTGVSHLADVIGTLGGGAHRPDLPEPGPVSGPTVHEAAVPDLADLIGQHEARAALEVAAAGGHHMSMTGPPGVGKTMLAARLPGILPDLSTDQAVTVTSVHSIAGTFSGAGLIHRPPFESPHHSATMAAIIGGGSGIPRPGAASRAHAGVLFLDESAEFAPRVLDSLRQPLEEGEVKIQRSYGVATYPARFQLVLASNPCPCGKASGKGLHCTCTPLARRRYNNRLSGPLLDRIDIRVQVEQVARTHPVQGAESSATVRERVEGAQSRTRMRLRGTPWVLNAHVPGAWYRRHTHRHAPALSQILEAYLDEARMSLRGIDRMLRLAWTVADLAARSAPTKEDLATAALLRSGGEYDN